MDHLFNVFLPHPCPEPVCLDQAVRDGLHSDPPGHRPHPHFQPPSPPPHSLHTSHNALGLGYEHQAPLVW